MTAVRGDPSRIPPVFNVHACGIVGMVYAIAVLSNLFGSFYFCKPAKIKIACFRNGGTTLVKLKDEISRVEATKGNVVSVNKNLYLNLLKEIKLLRFKVHQAKDWDVSHKNTEYKDISRLLFEFWQDQRNGDLKMADKKNEVKAAATPEVQVGIKKVEAFKKYLEEAKIEGFGLQDFENDVHAQAFRSNLPVAGNNLPFMILLDDSVYTMLQVQVAANIVTAEKKAFVCEYLNELNDQYRMLKYNVDEAGNVIMTCCIPAGLDHFEPALVIAILNQVQGHLSALYPTIMEKLWKK